MMTSALATATKIAPSLLPVSPISTVSPPASSSTPAPVVAPLPSLLPLPVLPSSAPGASLLQQPLVVLHQLTHLVRQLQRQSLNTARLGPKQNELANKTKDFRLRLSDNLQA